MTVPMAHWDVAPINHSNISTWKNCGKNGTNVIITTVKMHPQFYHTSGHKSNKAISLKGNLQ
jgi:hypothetical protein